MAVTFTSQDIQFALKNKRAIKEWVKNIIESEKKIPGQLNYVFVNDEALLKLNLDYLDHNTYTDIITFDYCEDKKINGDLFISIDRVKENAKKFNVSFEDELHRVMIHGVLHLCGYNDKNIKDANLIRKKESASLNKRRH